MKKYRFKGIFNVSGQSFTLWRYGISKSQVFQLFINGLTKETELLRFFQKAIVPTFCLPDYLPDPDLALRTARLIKILKEMV